MSGRGGSFATAAWIMFLIMALFCSGVSAAYGDGNGDSASLVEVEVIFGNVERL